MSVQTLTIKNIGFVTTIQFTIKVLSLITAIILARILSSEEYGIIGIALVFINFINQMSDFGLQSAVIYRKEQTDEVLHTGATLRIIISSILYLVIFLIAPIGANFFNENRVENVIKILGIIIILSSAGFISQTKIAMQLKFKSLVIPRIISGLTNSLTTIILAYLGFSYWSLVYGQLLSSIVFLIALYYVLPWKLKFFIDKNIAKDLLNFGFFVVLNSLVAFLLFNIDRISIGRILSIEQVGYYAIALFWGAFVYDHIGVLVNQVLFPVFAKIRENKEQLGRAYLKTMHFLSIVVFPISLGMIIIAKEFAIIILGKGTDKWVSAILPLQILCVYGLIRALLIPSGNVLFSLGKVRFYTYLGILMLVVIGIFILPSIFYFQIIGVALLFAIAFVFDAMIELHFFSKWTGIKIKEILKTISLPFISSLIMFFLVFLFKFYFSIKEMFGVFVYVVLGIAIYLCCLYVFSKGEIIKEIKNVFRSLVSR